MINICLQNIVSPDKLSAEVLATPPFSLCLISAVEASKHKGIYISTPSLRERIFIPINLSSSVLPALQDQAAATEQTKIEREEVIGLNKVLSIFLDFGQKLPL